MIYITYICVAMIKQFKDKSHNWWLNFKVFSLINGKIVITAGGIATEEELIQLEKYLKRKKLI